MIANKHHFSYLAVATTCLITHNVVMIGTDAAGFPLVMAVLSSYLAVILLGYFLHSQFTFSEVLSWTGFSRYALAMSFNIPVSFTVVWILKSALGLPMWIASPVATVCTLSINYFISRWAIVTLKHVSE